MPTGPYLISKDLLTNSLPLRILFNLSRWLLTFISNIHHFVVLRAIPSLRLTASTRYNLSIFAEVVTRRGSQMELRNAQVTYKDVLSMK